MQLTKTEIQLPEEKVIATAGNFISLGGVKRFYEYPVQDLGQFDALHMVVRSSGNSKLLIDQFGRPEQDNLTYETMLAPNLVKAITVPRLEFARRVYFECASTLDILGVYGLTVEGLRGFAPAKFRYRHSRPGKSPTFGRHSVILPAGTTELGLTEDSVISLTAPRIPAVVNCGQDIYHFVGTISFTAPKDLASVLITCEDAVECRPQIMQTAFVPQVQAKTVFVKNEYS